MKTFTSQVLATILCCVVINARAFNLAYEREEMIDANEYPRHADVELEERDGLPAGEGRGGGARRPIGGGRGQGVRVKRPDMGLSTLIDVISDDGELPPPARHYDDEMIEICKESMELCEWTVEELVLKIEQRTFIDKNIEYSGTGTPVGPAVDPMEIDRIANTPVTTPATGKQPVMGRPGQGQRRSSVPRRCLPFGVKYRRSRKYKIQCTRYLFDRAIRKYQKTSDAARIIPQNVHQIYTLPGYFFTASKIPTTPTTTPTTTPSTTPKTSPAAPPSTGPPREPESPHPYDEKIAICLRFMEDCPWSAEELVSKITESLNINTSVEFSGEGDPGVPVLDPNSISEYVYAAQSVPGEPSVAPTELVPEKCLPFGKKYLSSKAYVITCRAYLSNTALKHFSQRKSAMIACFKCRRICEAAGAVTFL